MKTAVSIPDDLFAQADAHARRFGKSRSQVYREALVEYLLRRDHHSVTTELDAVLATVDDGDAGWVDLASRRTLERAEW